MSVVSLEAVANLFLQECQQIRLELSSKKALLRKSDFLLYIQIFMSHRGICMTVLRALLVFAWADVTVSQEAELSVGKVRSSADVAFSNGEIDQALKLWGKVNQLN